MLDMASKAFRREAFRMIFGDGSVMGDYTGRTYVITGHGALVLSDLFDAAGFFFGKFRTEHGRTYGHIARTMYERDLRVSFRTSSQDMHIDCPQDPYSHDAVITSDGRDLAVRWTDSAVGRVQDSLDGYGLTCLCAKVVRTMFGTDFHGLDACAQAAVRCSLYLDIVGPEFFRRLLKIARSSRTDDFEGNVDRYVTEFMGTYWGSIERCLSCVLSVAGRA